MKTFAERIKQWWAPVNRVAESLMVDGEGHDSINEDIRMVVEGLLGLANSAETLPIAVALCGSFLNCHIGNQIVRIKPCPFSAWSVESLGSEPQKSLLIALYSSETDLV